MKKLFLLCGLLAIGFVVSAGVLDVSTKAKHPIVVVEEFDFVTVDVEVPRETFGLEPIKVYAEIPIGFFMRQVHQYNDPYLHRSSRWIRENNLYINGTANKFDTSKSFKTQFLS